MADQQGSNAVTRARGDSNMRPDTASAGELGVVKIARRDLVLCVLLTALAFVMVSILVAASQTRERDTTARALSTDAVTVAELLERDLAQRQRALGRMALRWLDRGSMPRREWEHDAAVHLLDHDGYERLAWVSGDLSDTWVVEPPGGALSAGASLTETPAATVMFAAMRERRAPTTSPLFRLPDGHVGLFIGVPLTAGPDPGAFVALLGVVDWFDTVVPAERRRGLHILLKQGNASALVHTARDASDVQVTVKLNSVAPDAVLQVTASQEYLATHSSGTQSVVLGLGLLLGLLVGVLSWLWARGSGAVRSAKLGERLLGLENDQRTAAQAQLEMTVKELVSSRRHLDSIVSHMPLAAAIWSEDDELLRWNEAYEEFHAPVRDLVEEGLRLETLVRAVAPARVSAGNADSVEEYVQLRLAQRAERGRSIVRRVDEKRFFRIVESPLPDGTLLETFSDISDVMQEKERAAERERELDDILAATSDGLSLYDKDDRLARWNERYVEIFPVVRDVVNDRKTFEELYRIAFNKVGADAVAVRERVERHRVGDGGVPIEFTTRDGFTFLVRDQPLDNGGSVVTYSDVTLLKRRESELRRSNLELEQFAYVASHDLQEPLRMVASYTQLLERQLSSELDGDSRDFMEYIVEGARRMQSLVNDLLTYSRVGSGEMELREVDLADVVGRARQNLHLQLEDLGASLIVDDLPTVPGVRTLLVQLFQNLIENGLKFRRDAPPEITISATEGDDMFEITVADNGIGISPEHLARIFEPFKRLHRKDEIPGNGIGLALCAKIVRLHGGRITVDSDVGRGTRFHVQLDTRLTEPAG
ncbi:MAG: PAS-domain containing protein [Pseudomonadota bacterium]